MLLFVAIVTALLSSASGSSANFAAIKHVGVFNVTRPSVFSEISKGDVPYCQESSLLLTSFPDSVLGHGSVYCLYDIMGKANWQILVEKTIWPNNVSVVPASVASRPTLAVASGFLVPLHTDGGIFLYDGESDPTAEPLVLTALSTGGPWFYHDIIWKDMNSDGKLDVLTARARVKTFGGSSNQLVWFEAPKWQEHVINNGGDVYIQNEKVPVKNVTYDVILAAVFFSKSVVITWTEGENWLDATKIHSRVISEEKTSPFALKYLDVNGDGRKDILVSLNDAKNGSVVVFEMPQDFRTGSFIRHELCHGFKAQPELIPMPGRGSPGFIYPLSMKTTATVLKKWDYDASKKMSFLLSGDDGGFVYILVPRSSDPGEWHYDPIPLFEAKTTVGDLYIKDLDGDGNEDVLVAAYNLDQVHIYSFTP